jgi:hypothetical protein
MVKHSDTASTWSYGNADWHNSLIATWIYWHARRLEGLRTVAWIATLKTDLGRSCKQCDGDNDRVNCQFDYKGYNLTRSDIRGGGLRSSKSSSREEQ